MQNAKRPCQNVANTMQNDWFQFKTVAKTRQMVLGKKANKKIQNLRQEKSKNYSTHLEQHSGVIHATHSKHQSDRHSTQTIWQRQIQIIRGD
jgi:hypothetical protein